MSSVAVLGGGPAGATAAWALARSGVKAILFDEKLAWEKPCGGGVTFKAWDRYSFLKQEQEACHVQLTTLSTPGAGSVQLRLDRPMLVFSRTRLNQILLDRAASAGADIRRSRVNKVTRSGDGWTITTAHGMQTASHIILALGARNPIREMGTAFTTDGTMSALGYFVPLKQAHADIEFFRALEGYIWVFPRMDHLSVGICGKGESAQALRKRLELYMDRKGLGRGEFYAHMLPALDHGSWSTNRIAGDRWLAAGDAAGLVDPVTGEGIYYAMRSGEIAGTLVASGAAPDAVPALYEEAIATEFGADLAYGATLAKRLFLGRYMFGPNTARFLQFLRRSPRLNGIVQELFAGTMPYHELRSRIKDSLHLTLTEIGVNLFLRRVAHEGLK